jgi:FkbM family methyltransferase
MAIAVGRAGLVHAYEPQRRVYQTLAANIALNDVPNVHAHWAALGSTPGTEQIADFDMNDAQNFGGFSLHEAYQAPKVEVPRMTLDGMKYQRLRLIKVDVEGYELDVLQGALATIEEHHPILYVEADRKERTPALLRWLRLRGYEIYVHEPPLFNPDNHAKNKINIFIAERHADHIVQFVSTNWLCFHSADATPRPAGGRLV